MTRNFIIAILIALVILFFISKRLQMSKKLSENFSLGEFTKGGQFNPTKDIFDNIKALTVNVLQPLRNHFGKPIIITSGYRPEWYNKSIGGSQTSEHITGSAADIKIDGVSNSEIINAVKLLKLPVNQLIDETKETEKDRFSKWVHISHQRGAKNKGVILLAKNDFPDLKMNYEQIGYV